jgi:diguanylate cyclase (GGDEF)-like protein
MPIDSLNTLLLSCLAIAGLPLSFLAYLHVWRQAQDAANALAFRDDLTGLGNRRAFTSRAEASLQDAKLGSVAMVLLDVDGLKTLNDNCGHQAGDELLATVAAQLEAAVRLGGSLYRIGGDEFAVLIERAKGESVASLLMSIVPVAAAFESCGHEHTIRVSYGYASCRDNEDFDSLFKRADSRLNEAKQLLYASGDMPNRRRAAHRAEESAPEDAALSSRLRLLPAVNEGSITSE